MRPCPCTLLRESRDETMSLYTPKREQRITCVCVWEAVCVQLSEQGTVPLALPRTEAGAQVWVALLQGAQGEGTPTPAFHLASSI